MGKIIYSFCKDGVRYDRPLQPDISVGDLVLNKENTGIAGKVISKSEDRVEVQFPLSDKTYTYPIDEIELVEKGGPGSGRYPAGSGKGNSPPDVKDVNWKNVQGVMLSSPVAGSYAVHLNFETGSESLGAFKDKSQADAYVKELSEKFKVNIDDKTSTKFVKGEPIEAKPTISEGAIVTLNGHKGKVI